MVDPIELNPHFIELNIREVADLVNHAIDTGYTDNSYYALKEFSTDIYAIRNKLNNEIHHIDDEQVAKFMQALDQLDTKRCNVILEWDEWRRMYPRAEKRFRFIKG